MIGVERWMMFHLLDRLRKLLCLNGIIDIRGADHQLCAKAIAVINVQILDRVGPTEVPAPGLLLGGTAGLNILGMSSIAENLKQSQKRAILIFPGWRTQPVRDLGPQGGRANRWSVHADSDDGARVSRLRIDARNVAADP